MQIQVPGTRPNIGREREGQKNIEKMPSFPGEEFLELVAQHSIQEPSVENRAGRRQTRIEFPVAEDRLKFIRDKCSQ